MKIPSPVLGVDFECKIGNACEYIAPTNEPIWYCLVHYAIRGLYPRLRMGVIEYTANAI